MSSPLEVWQKKFFQNFFCYQ